jgi:predicted metalloendopeptidase
VILPLYLYNQTILRNAMEKAASDKQAHGSERQIGDFWQSCMDEAGRDAHGKSWLQSDLKTIEALESSKDLARLTAYLHLNFSAVWHGDDNSTKAPLFGFGPTQDLADASKMVAGIDQGGMALPSLDYYLESAGRFQKLRDQYVKHVENMFELAGGPVRRGGPHSNGHGNRIRQGFNG